MSARIRAVLARAAIEWQALWAWWAQELRELAQAVLGTLAPAFLTQVVIRLEKLRGQLWVGVGAAARAVARFERDVQGALPATLEPAEGETVRLSGTRALVILAPEEVLVQTLRLPAALERELDRVIALHLEREWPVAPERMGVDVRIAARDRRARQITVEVMLVHRARLERLRAQLEAWGIRAARIARAGPSGEPIGNFLPQRFRLRRVHLRPLERTLLASLGALAALMLATIGGQWLYERIVVGAELARAQAQAAAVEPLARALHDRAAPAERLGELIAAPDGADVLAALTGAIPTEAWAYEIEIQAPSAASAEVRLGAFAPAATLLVGRLEGLPQFSQVQLLSAASAGLGSGMDRLQLSARWAPSGAPDPTAMQANLAASPGVRP